MKQSCARALLLLASLLVASSGYGAQLSWTLPTVHKDGTPMDAADVRKIVVKVYWGPTKDGPWQHVASSYPGGSTATVPDPPPAKSRWYTVKSTLDGAESEFAVPVRKTNYSIPVSSFFRKIAKAAIARKKMVLLMVMVLLLGLAGFLRYRGKRRRG